MISILWFSNTPANADGHIDLNSKGKGGWLKTLNQELQSKVEKENSETELNEAKIIKTLEEAESEDLKNNISTYTAGLNIDAQEIANQQAAQELNNGINQSGSTGVEQPPRNQGSI